MPLLLSLRETRYDGMRRRHNLKYLFLKLFDFPAFSQDETSWGNIIRKFFLNSRGFSVAIDDKAPLFVSLNKTHGFCLQARYGSNQFIPRKLC